LIWIWRLQGSNPTRGLLFLIKKAKKDSEKASRFLSRRFDAPFDPFAARSNARTTFPPFAQQSASGSYSPDIAVNQVTNDSIDQAATCVLSCRILPA